MTIRLAAALLVTSLVLGQGLGQGLGLGGHARAQTHDGMAMPPAAASTAPHAGSTEAYRAADEAMMHDMTREMTGDADRDFAAGMIPHHRGAVAMAKVELRYGHDPKMRRLAYSIIATQKQEIALMQSWQKRHPAKG